MKRTLMNTDRPLAAAPTYPHFMQLETRRRELQRALELRRLKREAKAARRQRSPTRARWTLLLGR
jgi:hypothetical protein